LKRTSRRKLTDVDLSPYAGRWVAIVHGRVTGVGASAVEAHAASKNQLQKEEPTVIFVHPDDYEK
jgi:hypothetical protein